MVQPSLFSTDTFSLMDGADGDISYHPGILSPEKAARWFAHFHQHIGWQAERRQMYEREVAVPRLHANLPLTDSLSPILADAFKLVTDYFAAPFDSVGLNLYRDNRDSVAPHNDKLQFLQTGQPIALLSLGATRRMVIRRKKPPRRRLHIDLETGSLLSMSWTSQLHYDHGIPKERDVMGPRISLAFRVARKNESE